MRALDTQIAQTEQAIREAEQNLQVIARNRQSLEQFDSLTGPSAAKAAETGKLVLDAEAITKLTLFQFEQRQRLTTQELELQSRRREMQAQLELLQRQRSEVAAVAVKHEQEAVVFVDKPAADAATVRLTYLVDGCGWSPAYNVRATTGGEQAQVEFNALIQQMSGEDWSDVELTLSTATPALSSAAPALAPFLVGLIRAASLEFNLDESLSNTSSGGYVQAQQMQQEALIGGQRLPATVDNLRNSWRMNVAGNDLQLLEQILPSSVMDRMRLSAPAEQDGPALAYTLGDRISLASRADQQIVRVAARDMPASLHHLALPVLTTLVFREAEVRNTSDTDLLGGTVTAYLDGRFVGRTELPTVARGQTFVVGFGADPQLRAEKHLVQRTESVQGGNQVVSFDYRLSVDNFQGQPVHVQIKDRLPYTRDDDDLGVTVTAMPTALSTDPVYVRLERPRQILRWDLDVPAHAHGEKAAVITYSYKIAYDRQLTLTNPLSTRSAEGAAAPADEAALIRDFEDLDRARKTY